jgi:hypothetical protein
MRGLWDRRAVALETISGREDIAAMSQAISRPSGTIRTPADELAQRRKVRGAGIARKPQQKESEK